MKPSVKSTKAAESPTQSSSAPSAENWKASVEASINQAISNSPETHADPMPLLVARPPESLTSEEREALKRGLQDPDLMAVTSPETKAAMEERAYWIKAAA
jgi:hypothetical protein